MDGNHSFSSAWEVLLLDPLPLSRGSMGLAVPFSTLFPLKFTMWHQFNAGSPLEAGSELLNLVEVTLS